MPEESPMTIRENVEFELDGRLRALALGKRHISVRYEPVSKTVRIGACISNYNWETRDQVIDVLLDFEDSHEAEFSVEFDVVPLEAVTDPHYAEI
jgi:hypothetical protein